MSGNLIQLHRDTDKSEKTRSSFANNSNETECNQKHFSKLLIPNNAEKVEPQALVRVQAPTDAGVIETECEIYLLDDSGRSAVRTAQKSGTNEVIIGFMVLPMERTRTQCTAASGTESIIFSFLQYQKYHTRALAARMTRNRLR